MNASTTIQADRYATAIENALWDGHKPSAFDWQVLLVFRTGKTRLYQFPKSYSLDTVIKRGQHWGSWDKAVAFLIRDTAGRVLYQGPVTNALGHALEPDWMNAVALAGEGA